ncbi:hypothetical protein HRG_013875 [Hirsutella rhossiliensis]
MVGRVHPFARTWEIERRDGLESDDDNITEYTIPALIVRDHSYQPVVPRTLGSADAFPTMQPIVSFTRPVIGSGRDLLRRNSAAALGDTQLRCCGFRMTERPDGQFQPNALLTCMGKIAGLLDHRIMAHAPAFEQDYIFFVVPDTWTFLDRAMSNQASSATQLLPTTPKRSVGNPSDYTDALAKFTSPKKKPGPPQAASPPYRLHLVNYLDASVSDSITPLTSISSRPGRARHPPKNIL